MPNQIKLGLESGARLVKKVCEASFLVLPFTSLHPIRLYLSLATSVAINKDRSTIRKVLFLHAFLFVNLLKNVYLSVVLPHNPLDRIRLADIVYLSTGEDFIYRIWSLLQALLLYYNYVLLNVKPVFLRFLEDLLFNKDQPLLNGFKQTSRSPLKNVKQSILWALNIIGLLKIICDILFWIVSSTILNEAIHHSSDLLGDPFVSPFLCTWRILQVMVGLTGLFLAIFLYSTVCTNVAAFACSTFTLLFLRLQLNAKQLTAWKTSLRHNFTWAPFTRYRAYSLETFSLLFIANQVWGPLFVAFVAVNLPVSAFCFVFLALGRMKGLKTILTFILLMTQGLAGTMILHWFMARLTKRFHAPSKALLALSSRISHRMGNFRGRLTLHLAICHLHTKRKYGYTYGSFGLVTMGSFSKCMILYSELIIYSYKLIKDI